MIRTKLFPVGRREFIMRGASVVAAAVVLGPAGLIPAAATAREREVSISAVEDLMREHGILSRLLLVYDRILSDIRSGAAFDPAALAKGTELLRSFIQDYHEKLEEAYVFPRLEKRHPDLVKVLIRQHEAGRVHTNTIRRLAVEKVADSPENRKTLGESLGAFITMYRPHKAREDTVVFPEFQRMVPAADRDLLAETFEKKERKMLGENGYQTVLGHVEELEKRLGIYDLARFTPAI